MAFGNIEVENDNLTTDIANRGAAERDVENARLDRIAALAVDNVYSTPEPQETPDAQAEDPAAPTTGRLETFVAEKQALGSFSRDEEPDEEDRPWVGLDVFSAAATGVLRGVAESGDAVGDLLGQDLDLSGKLEENVIDGSGLDTTSVAGETISSISQFLVPFGAAFKVLRAFNWARKGWVAGAAAGGVADFAAFDPNEKRLSDMWVENFPEMELPFQSLVLTEEDDSNLEGRFKNMAEGAVLGLGLELGGAIVRSMRGAQKTKEVYRQFDHMTEADFDKIEPAFRGELMPAMENLRLARERVDIFRSAREALMALDEADPAFIAAREYLQEKAAGRTGKDLPKLSEDALKLVDDAEFRAGSDGPKWALDELEQRAANARELSPLAALRKEDDVLAKTFEDLLGDAHRTGGTTPGGLDGIIAEAEVDLRRRLVEWEGVRTSDQFRVLDDELRVGIDEAITQSRHTPESGFRYLDVEREFDERIRSTLANRGERVLPRGLQTETIDGVERAIAGDVKPKPTKTFLADGIRLSQENARAVLGAVAEGDVATASRLLADGTNMNFVLSDDSRVQSLYAEMGRMFEKNHGKKKITHAESKAQADTFFADVVRHAEEDPAKMEQYLNDLMPDSKISQTSKILAIRTVEGMIAGRTADLAQRVLNGNTNSRITAEFMQASQALLRINESRRFLQADIGRALNSMKVPVFAKGVNLDQIDALIREAPMNPTKLARKMRASIGNPHAMTDLAKELRHPGWEAVNGYWYSSLLSGPTTHAVNIASNAAVAVLRPVEDILGGLLQAPVTRDLTQVQEGAEALIDLFRGFSGAMETANKAWRTGESQLIPNANTLEQPMPKSGPFHGLVEGQNGPLYSMVRAVSTVFDLPTRLLTTEDEFFKGMNYFVNSQREARRHVRRMKPDLKGPAFDKEVAALANDAKDWAEMGNRVSREKVAELKAIHESSIESAKYNTFTNELNYGLGQSIQQMAAKHPAMRLLMPFIRTPTNLIRFAAQRVPAAGLIQKQNRELAAAAAAGNKDAVRDLVGRQTIGTMIMGSTALMFAQGQVTGGGPKDPGQREVWQNTHQAYSIKTPSGEWIDYSRIEPFGALMALQADAMTFLSEAKDEEDKTNALGIMVSLMATTAANIASKRYLQGITEFMTMASRGDTDTIKRYILRQTGNLAPLANFQNQVNRAFNDPVLREAESIKDSIYAKIPTVSESVEPRLNMWGEEVHLRPGYSYGLVSSHTNGVDPSAFGKATSLVVPGRNKPVSLNEVRNELTRIKFSLSTRRSFGYAGDVKLTVAERNQFIKLTNQLPGSRTTLEEKIARSLFRPNDQRTDQAKRQDVEKIVRKAKARALTRLQRSNAELDLKIRRKKALRKARTANQEERAEERLDSLRRQLTRQNPNNQ